ncbi:MAG: sterol-binding protein [Candidatus Ruthia sp.]|nr:sterol-binding protein [Candidatus Ruthturnera sp.]MBT6922893.1 sterol-binding protein [Candidatus Ruthturnera sp.]
MHQSKQPKSTIKLSIYLLMNIIIMTITHILQRGLPLPFTLIPNAFSNQVIVAVFNQIFKEAINAGDLDFLKNNCVLIEVSDIGLSFALSLKNKSLVGGNDQQIYDLCISAKLCHFLSMVARKKDPDTLFFQRKIKMQGSTELGLYVKNFLDGFDVESHWFSCKTDQALQKSYPILEKLFCKNSK